TGTFTTWFAYSGSYEVSFVGFEVSFLSEAAAGDMENRYKKAVHKGSFPSGSCTALTHIGHVYSFFSG
ncbi:MAG TPA: hypothetical protein VN580_13865, partial [Clostridia bacterium]|nr:hypothetical protein [Clostridia bacterium]